LGENGRFDARNINDSLLTIAPIEAFGFLTNSPASITIRNSNLSVSEDKTLSMIGGDLQLSGELVFDEYDKQQFRKYADSVMNFNFKIPIYSNQLSAESGQINLASIASQGEILLTESNIELIGNGGQITVHNTDINVNGEGGGSIFIRAGKLKLINSYLESQTLGNQNGELIDIKVDNFIMQGGENYAGINTDTLGTGRSSTINLQAKQMHASGGATISGNVIGSGDSATINIKIEDNLIFLGEIIPKLGKNSGIESIVMNTSPNLERNNSGSISIEADQLTLIDSASIATITFGAKYGASINIKVHDSLKISGIKFFGKDFSFSSGIMTISFTNSPILQSYGITSGGGNSGNIKIEAGQIELEKGGIIDSTSYIGKAGDISIKVSGLLKIIGRYKNDIASAISTNTLGKDDNSGNGGNINIQANKITTDKGGSINSATFGSGKAGDIFLEVTDLLKITGQYKDGIASSISTSTLSKDNNAGNGGHINIQAKQIILDKGGSIRNVTFGPGDAGNTFIKATDSLTISDGYEIPRLINQQIGLDELLPSVIIAISRGSGKAGNIELTAGKVNLINGGQINSDTANTGKGGSIQINTDSLVVKGKFSDNFSSSVTSSSTNSLTSAGHAGHIIIQAKELKLIEGGIISTSAANAGGGDVIVTSPESVYLRKGQIITSVRGGVSNGGNIHITNPVHMTLNKGVIKAQADAGHGGNITIIADNVTLSQKSIIDASSRKGVDGNIFISSPSGDISGELLALSVEFKDMSSQLKTPCNSRIADNISSFITVFSEGTSNVSDDLLPSGLLLTNILLETPKYSVDVPNKNIMLSNNCY
ncbi:MAG: hypothetical protein QM487_01530, partial [Candidatus Marithrix sp.]